MRKNNTALTGWSKDFNKPIGIHTKADMGYRELVIIIKDTAKQIFGIRKIKKIHTKIPKHRSKICERNIR